MKKAVQMITLGFVLIFSMFSVQIAMGSEIPVEAPKGVHLNISGDPRHEIAINWYTHTDTETSVEFGLTNDVNGFTLDGENVEKSSEKQTIAEEPVDGQKSYTHHTVLKNLLPNTTYFYRVGGETSGWSKVFNFTTSPESDKDGSETFHFMVMGDNRSDRNLRKLVVNVMLQNETTFFNTPAQMVIHVGDFVHRGSYYDLWNNYWSDVEILNSRIPIAPIQGNHEFGSTKSYYLDQFVLPTNGDSQYHYAFRYASAFFIGADSEEGTHGLIPYSGQSKGWTQEALRLSNSDPHTLWNFAYYHQPYYVSAGHGAREDLKERWGPLFDEAGLDMSFAGHSHHYERSYPVSYDGILDTQDKTNNYTDPKYPIYVISGTAGMGGPIGDGPDHENDHMAFFNKTWEYVDIQISNNYSTMKSVLDMRVVGILPSYVGTSANATDLSNTFIMDNITITKDIPEAFLEAADTAYIYDNITDPTNAKTIGLVLTFILLAGLVIIDVWIIKVRKNREKSEQK